MTRAPIASLVLLLSLLSGGMGWQKAGPDKVTCCEKNMDCCHRGYKCCRNPQAIKCCAQGLGCCKHTSACCRGN